MNGISECMSLGEGGIYIFYKFRYTPKEFEEIISNSMISKVYK